MKNISCCGSNCSDCYCYGNLCKGCNESKGKVFHVKDDKTCSIYDCVINNKKYSKCIECKNIPCNIWKKTRDPKYSDDEFQNNIQERITNMK